MLPQMISGADSLVKYFGYWPEFCDAKVRKFQFDGAGTIELTLHYIDVSADKSATVCLRFSGVSDIELGDIKTENIIDRIAVEGRGPFVVSIEAAYGLCGEFRCLDIGVGNAQV